MSGFLNPGVNIGNITLTGFEVPDSVHWGTVQLVKEFVFPGGRNVLQPLGPTREPISWSARMFNYDATDRARELDQLAASGAIVPCSWGDFSFDGMVERFSADYKHQWDGRYSITLRVVWDYAQQTAAIDPATSSANDIGTASGLVALPGLANAASAIIAAQGGSGGLSVASGTIQGALSALGSSAAGYGAGLGVPVTPLNLVGLVGNAGSLAATVTAYGYVARALGTWQAVPGIGTPNPRVQGNTDLTQYVGA